MRCLVISDIHANIIAFDAVLDDAAGDYDFVWCLGDVVGYGPDPNACVERLRSLEHLAIAGNHDWAALGRLDISTFNADARRVVNWTREQLTPESVKYLDALPTTFVVGDYTLAHGSPREPIWEYILDPLIATLNFPHFETPYCLVGHTHLPVMFRQTSEGNDCEAFLPDYQDGYSLNASRQIINPGSVGQPRDSNPLAAYALLDVDQARWEPRRVTYDIDKVQNRMREFDMPTRLIARLEHGW
jgi:diadenosine tetraphosphatase ApaH/serine/threonine PP2A family protein phosphatase